MLEIVNAQVFAMQYFLVLIACFKCTVNVIIYYEDDINYNYYNYKHNLCYLLLIQY